MFRYGFESFRDELIADLPARVLPLVAGTTDSELAGAVFAANLAGFPERRSYDLISLRAAMLSTVAQLRVRSLAAHQNMTYGSCDAADLTPSSLNFAVSDGRHLVVIRYRSSPVEGGVEARPRRASGGHLTFFAELE